VKILKMWRERFKRLAVAISLILFVVIASRLLLFGKAATGTATQGDLNKDGIVNITDLSILLTNWGRTNAPDQDVNNDGTVNIFDLSVLLSNYGKSVTPPAPPPSPPPSTSVVPAGIPGTWTLKFSDEFNGTSLDLAKWSHCWFSPTCGTMNNVSTSPANVAVTGGNLVLTLASQTTGALVSSNPRGGATTGYQFQYGVVEARIHFPGDGTNCYNWPAWWTDGQSWPTDGENDIAEVLRGPMTVNYHSSSGAHNQGSVPGYWCGGFHTYALHRKAGAADVYYDGIKVKSYTTDDTGNPHYLILNVGYTSSFPVYGTASQVKVDYVRAW
jgi:hypothetical protein